jgi:peptidyl-prolyl cis-trans isomerase A (cyclophilin A)
VKRPALVIIGVFGLAATVLGWPGRPAQGGQRSLLNPGSFTETAPPTFSALFSTTAGMFVIAVHRDWAPRGADRFYNLAKNGFYTNSRFFRVVPKFMAQFGISGDPNVSAAWSRATLPPDRALKSNIRGRVTFAMGSTPDTRTTQLFINYGDNSRLDIDGFAPIGEVTSSMILVEQIFSKYGEDPDQGRIETEGNNYLIKFFPRLDFIKKVTLEQSAASNPG